MNKLIATISLYFFCHICMAQQDTAQTYITTFKEKLVTSISVESNNDSFYISYKDDAATDASRIKFSPNSQMRLVGNVSYKILNFSFGFTPSFLKTNKELESSKDIRFSTRFSFKKWQQSITIIKQKGFLLDFKDPSKYFFPELQSLKIGRTTSYVFNDKFSYKTLFNYNEWQKKSAGSFIANLAIYYTNLKSYDSNNPINSEIYSATISPAYYYNLVINKRFLIGGGASLGAGLTSMDGEVNVLSELSMNAKMGYNHKNFFSFFSYSGTSFFLNHTNESYNNSFEFLKLEIGYRFDPPKKLKKIYHKIL
ncbi:DUF4421 domain-containing protein [Flavobacterium agricola]|uniref:DUF4421 domain-containing protein n=1 Tax=Flavobacterium agricola TaxID=2870839 RepID=A0ABY6LY71_9FLAO|nr:DUF4421 domain-containing protein [Flavobacterium agricola]UYW00932.1 DUF4421 domain-containing protein [Flavobacterium agricola]